MGREAHEKEEVLRRFPVGSYARIVGATTWQAHANSRDRKKTRVKRRQRIGQVVQILYMVISCPVWTRLVVQPISGEAEEEDYRD
jgi:hypothetical protein